MERGTGQRVLQVVRSLLQLVEEHRVLAADLVREQRDGTGDDHEGKEEGEPGRQQRREPVAAEPGGERLEQRGRQHRRDERQGHEAQEDRQAEGEVDDQACQQQAPGPGSRRLEEPGHVRVLVRGRRGGPCRGWDCRRVGCRSRAGFRPGRGLIAAGAFRRSPRHAVHVTNYRGAMHLYRERLSAPPLWWVVGMASMLTFGAIVWTGFDVAITLAVFAALILITAAFLLNWGRATIEVTSGELRF